MRIPITGYGLPQVLWIPLVLLLIAAAVCIIFPVTLPWPIVAGIILLSIAASIIIGKHEVKKEDEPPSSP